MVVKLNTIIYAVDESGGTSLFEERKFRYNLCCYQQRQ